MIIIRLCLSEGKGMPPLKQVNYVHLTTPTLLYYYYFLEQETLLSALVHQAVTLKDTCIKLSKQMPFVSHRSLIGLKQIAEYLD